MNILKLTLPWPPSNNHYWGSRGNCRYLTRQGINYRNDVLAAVWNLGDAKPFVLRGTLRVEIIAYPPDRRARDLDNLLKAPLDALAHAGVYVDDKQIAYLSIERDEVRGKWFRRKIKDTYQQERIVWRFTLVDGYFYVDSTRSDELLNEWEWLDGTPCGKKVMPVK